MNLRLTLIAVLSFYGCATKNEDMSVIELELSAGSGQAVPLGAGDNPTISTSDVHVDFRFGRLYHGLSFDLVYSGHELDLFDVGDETHLKRDDKISISAFGGGVTATHDFIRGTLLYKRGYAVFPIRTFEDDRVDEEPTADIIEQELRVDFSPGRSDVLTAALGLSIGRQGWTGGYVCYEEDKPCADDFGRRRSESVMIYGIHATIILQKPVVDRLSK